MNQPEPQPRIVAAQEETVIVEFALTTPEELLQFRARLAPDVVLLDRAGPRDVIVQIGALTLRFPTTLARRLEEGIRNLR